MWSPKLFEIKNKTLDLSSSGQSNIFINELYADDICISNAIELNNWGDESIQLIVCDHCAIVQCKPGNWGTLRKAGDYILLIPDFNNMLQGEWEFNEFAPPFFMKNDGAIFFSLEQYNSLLELVPSILSIKNIKKLNIAEAVWLMQWEAPVDVLTTFPNPIKFRRDKFLCTNQDSDNEAINSLINLFNIAESSISSVELRPVFDESNKVSFYFDNHQYLEWQPMCKFEDSWQLMLKPNLQIIIT